MFLSLFRRIKRLGVCSDGFIELEVVSGGKKIGYVKEDTPFQHLRVSRHSNRGVRPSQPLQGDLKREMLSEEKHKSFREMGGVVANTIWERGHADCE